MKKIVVYFLVVVLSVVIFLFGINYQKVRQPHTYYKVYLDSELIGMIESKDELKKYINKQADLIRDNIREYNLKISAIDTYNSYSKNIKDGSNLDKANTILKNKDTYKLSEIDIENLNYYINEGLYNYSDIEQENMKNYVTENDIFTKVNDIDTPNGIEIKKVYTYNSDVETIQEIYR